MKGDIPTYFPPPLCFFVSDSFPLLCFDVRCHLSRKMCFFSSSPHHFWTVFFICLSPYHFLSSFFPLFSSFIFFVAHCCCLLVFHLIYLFSLSRLLLLCLDDIFEGTIWKLLSLIYTVRSQSWSQVPFAVNDWHTKPFLKEKGHFITCCQRTKHSLWHFSQSHSDFHMSLILTNKVYTTLYSFWFNLCFSLGKKKSTQNSVVRFRKWVLMSGCPCWKSHAPFRV